LHLAIADQIPKEDEKMAEGHEGSEEFYEMMEDGMEKGYQKENLKKRFK